MDNFKAMLACYSVNVDALPESDGSLTLAIDDLEILVNADTKDAAITDLVNELKLYANDYFTRLPLFLSAPNRKAHLPIVLRVLLAEDDDEIRSIFNFK